jgi:heme exporter protein C
MGGATPETARFAAVVGIAAAADVPVVIVSVRLWRTIHPAVLVTREGGHGLQDPRMVVALLVALAAFTALVIWLMMLRIALVRANARLRHLAREIGLAQAALQDL